MIGVGIWTVVDKVYVAQVISDDLFSVASYLAIVVGVILLGVAVLGICAVRSEAKILVIIVSFAFIRPKKK